MSEHLDAEGVPFTMVEHAETKGRRLYLDGEPFPYATSGDMRVERTPGLTVVWVPVAVHGPVTIRVKPAGSNRFPDFTVSHDADGAPESVLLNGTWRKLA
jgi:hypothetical protein